MRVYRWKLVGEDLCDACGGNPEAEQRVAVKRWEEARRAEWYGHASCVEVGANGQRLPLNWVAHDKA